MTSNILKQDGEFAEEQPEVVDDDRGPEGFRGSEFLVRRQIVKVSAHAVFDCRGRVC